MQHDGCTICQKKNLGADQTIHEGQLNAHRAMPSQGRGRRNVRQKARAGRGTTWVQIEHMPEAMQGREHWAALCGRGAARRSRNDSGAD